MRDALILFSCFFICMIGVQGATVTRPDAQTISIVGVIDEKTSKEVSSLIDSKVKRIAITSEGGRTDSALNVADIMRRYRLDVKVIDYCMSSCANYIFIAGDKKEIAKKSILMWHGGQTSMNCVAADCSYFNETKKREQLLYLNSGVSFDLIMYSALLTMGVPDGRRRIVTLDGKPNHVNSINSQYQGWAPGSDILKSLGVKKILGKWALTESQAIEILKTHGFHIDSIYTGPAFGVVPDILKD